MPYAKNSSDQRMDELKLTPDTLVEPPPAETAFDYSLAVAKAATIMLPFLGQAVTLFDLITAPARGKRLADWYEQLRVAINDLSQRIEGLTPEKLATDDQFVSAVLRASLSVVRTHQAEKLDALRNAVLNIAIGGETNADRQTVFLELIDRFTPLHLALLKFFQDPDGYIRAKCIEIRPERENQPIYLLVLDCLPNTCEHLMSPLKERDAALPQFLDNVVIALAEAALITPDLKNAYQKPPSYPRWTTHLGDDFLDFIASPIDTGGSSLS